MKKKTLKKTFLGLSLSLLLTLGISTIVSAETKGEITERRITQTLITEEAAAQDDTLTNDTKAILPSIANMYQSKVAATSAEVTWSSVSGATYYEVSMAPYGSNSFQILGNISGTSCKLTGLKAGSRYDVRVLPRNSYDYSNYYSRLTVYTKPGSIGMKSIVASGQTSQITMKSHSYATLTGYRVIYNNLKTKGRATKYFTSSGVFTQELNKNAFYKIQITPVMRLNNKNYYASKDTIVYTALQPKLSKVGATSSSMTVKWPMVHGATSYSVYLKKPGQTSYKKVATTKSKTYRLSGMRQNQTYYIYVTANKKAGSKTWKSVLTNYYTMRVYTVYR